MRKDIVVGQQKESTIRSDIKVQVNRKRDQAQSLLLAPSMVVLQNLPVAFPILCDAGGLPFLASSFVGQHAASVSQ
jgi:hypothetical protein